MRGGEAPIDKTCGAGRKGGAAGTGGEGGRGEGR